MAVAYDRLLEVAVQAAEAAGRHALDHAERRKETHENFDHDVKLVLDIECQAVAEGIIRRAFPEHGILGEEGSRPVSDSPYEWIIDPIDGTMNFTHGLPYWCCSIAVRRENEVLAGAVYAPEHDRLYTATADGPALRNGNAIRASDTARLEEALLFTGISKHMESDHGLHFGVFSRLVRGTRKARITGSAALDLCHVADGTGDTFYESGIYLWDYAAAGLIARRAGAVLSLYPEPQEPHRCTVLCANRHLIDGLKGMAGNR